MYYNVVTLNKLKAKYCALKKNDSNNMFLQKWTVVVTWKCVNDQNLLIVSHPWISWYLILVHWIQQFGRLGLGHSQVIGRSSKCSTRGPLELFGEEIMRQGFCDVTAVSKWVACLR
jgi:hypothetical protein